MGWAGTALDRERLKSAVARCAALHQQTHEEYIERIERGSANELCTLVEQLAVGETYFFRDRGQFSMIERLLKRSPSPVRVLCAGCSTGEEPYSIAIALLATGVRGEVLGVDASASALAIARRGVYSRWSLRETPDSVIDAWFETSGKQFALNQAPKRLVEFRQLNLYQDSIEELGGWDIILCRNVLMYHGKAAASEIVAKLAQQLAPGGYLFLGHAETLRGMSEALEVEQADGAFFYRQHSGGVSPKEAVALSRDSTGTDEAWFTAIQSSTDRIAELTRGSQPPPSEEPGADWLDMLLEQVREGEPASALALLNAAPRVVQEESRALRAALLLMAGREREARDVAEGLVAHGKFLPEAHYVIALCLSHAGELSRAIESLEFAHSLDPAFAMPVMQAGLHKCRVGEPAQGRRFLRRAATLLEEESEQRVLLFGGGFSRDALRRICLRSSDGGGAS